MGGSSSTPKADSLMDHHHQPYPDMNMIFRGIPKMIQVADDMHRMTNYVMDLRNMTFAIVCLSIIAMILFFIMKLTQSRSSNARRKSELQQLQRRKDSIDERSMQRSNHFGGYHGYLDSWHDGRHKNVVLDIEKSPLSKPSSEEGNSNDANNISASIDSRHLLNGHAHKRLEPVKLLVEDLPYADT